MSVGIIRFDLEGPAGSGQCFGFTFDIDTGFRETSEVVRRVGPTSRELVPQFDSQLTIPLERGVLGRRNQYLLAISKIYNRRRDQPHHVGVGPVGTIHRFDERRVSARRCGI